MAALTASLQNKRPRLTLTPPARSRALSNRMRSGSGNSDARSASSLAIRTGFRAPHRWAAICRAAPLTCVSLIRRVYLKPSISDLDFCHAMGCTQSTNGRTRLRIRLSEATQSTTPRRLRHTMRTMRTTQAARPETPPQPRRLRPHQTQRLRTRRMQHPSSSTESTSQTDRG
jgi:hypothetical protein